MMWTAILNGSPTVSEKGLAFSEGRKPEDLDKNAQSTGKTNNILYSHVFQVLFLTLMISIRRIFLLIRFMLAISNISSVYT